MSILNNISGCKRIENRNSNVLSGLNLSISKDKLICHIRHKSLICLIISLFYFNGFSQDTPVKNLGPKAKLELSNQFSEKASWFTDMPQYNNDSSLFYSNKAYKVLDADEPLHQFKLQRLQFERLKKNIEMLPLASKDSIIELEWNKFKDISLDSKENRFLQFDYLNYWSDIKMGLADRPASLDLFTKAISILEIDKNRETQAKIDIHKGLFYAKYGLPEEKPLSIKNLHSSLNYYKNNHKEENSAELYMIYAQLIYNYTGRDQDSTTYYYELIKPVLDNYQKPLAHLFYHTMYSYDLIQQEFKNPTPNGERYEEAKNNVAQALNILTTYNMEDNMNYPYCFVLLGDIDFYTKNYEAALANYKKSYERYKAINTDYYATSILECIADTYYEMGDLENAFSYQKEYYQTLLDTEKEKNERSFRESELQLDILKQDKTLVRAQSQQTILLVIIGIGILVLILIYRNYRLKQTSNMKLGEANKELNIKNKQNELLLKEIHHRVKNNLELVKSLLALQSAQLEDSATKDAMMASQNRVQSMGIIHQKLYQGENLGSIEMKDYFLNLGEGILDTFNAENKVKIECAMDNLELDVDTAVPIGLIVNELLTNALKYAFPNDSNGNILISLSQSTPETLTLKVADNGVGKVIGLSPKGTGFGTQLIKLLTQQLDGKMVEEHTNGTSILFQFKTKPAA